MEALTPRLDPGAFMGEEERAEQENIKNRNNHLQPCLATRFILYSTPESLGCYGKATTLLHLLFHLENGVPLILFCHRILGGFIRVKVA